MSDVPRWSTAAADVAAAAGSAWCSLSALVAVLSQQAPSAADKGDAGRHRVIASGSRSDNGAGGGVHGRRAGDRVPRGLRALVAWADRHTESGPGPCRAATGPERARTSAGRAGDRVQPSHRGETAPSPRRPPGGAGGSRTLRPGRSARPGPPRGAASAGDHPPRRPDGAHRELKALIVSAPVDLRDQLRGLTTAAQVAKCAAFRLPAAPLDELTATKQALRSLARRIKTLTAEAAQTSMRARRAVAPHLLDQGVGPITAAQIYIAWSHPGRCRNEAAFARLAGVAPAGPRGRTPATASTAPGDRQLNRALAVTREPLCPHTQAYIAKRTAEGKTPREAQRCQTLHRASSNTPKSTLDKHRSIVSAKGQEISEGAGSSRRSLRREGRSRSRAAVDRGGAGCCWGIAGSGARERGCG